MQKSFTEDQNELNMPGTGGHIPENPENVYVSQILNNRSGDEIPAKLPSKLSLCRIKQLGPYIGEEMMRQYRLRGGKLKKKGYGYDEWRMDDWDNETWPWSKVKGWSNAHFPKDKNITQTQFYRNYIEFLFQKHNLDPETHVEKRSSVTKTREHNIKKRNRVKVISDSDSDVTSRSDVSRSRLNLSNSSNSSGSSSEGAAARNTTATMTNSLPPIIESNHDEDDGVMGDTEQEDAPVATEDNFVNEAQQTTSLAGTDHVTDPAPQQTTPQPQAGTDQVTDDQTTSQSLAGADTVNNAGDESTLSDSSYEEVSCDKCKVSSNTFEGQWHQNLATEGEYLCDPCMVELTRNRQKPPSKTPPPPRRGRRPTNEQNNVTPMLLRLRSAKNATMVAKN